MRLPYGMKWWSIVAARALVAAFMSSAGTALAMEPVDDTDPTQWRSIALAVAQSAAAEVEDPYRRAEVFASIARVQAAVEGTSAADKSIHEALQAAARIEAAEFRGWVLYDIVLAQVVADDVFGAKQTAESISATRPQGAAFTALVSVQVRSGKVPAAQALVPRIRDPEARGEVLRQIVGAHCAKGDVAAAARILPDIEDKYYSALAHGDVAATYVQEGDITAAHAIAARAQRGGRDEVYGRIALAQAARSDVSGALRSLQKINDPVAKAMAYGRIALQRIDRDDSVIARELLATALRSIQQARVKPQAKLLPIAQLARFQALAGDTNAARETLRRTRSEADRLPPGAARDELLDYIGRSQARAGDVREAIDAAKSISDRVMQALLIRDAVSLHSNATTANAAALASEFSDPLVDAAAQFGVLSQQSFRAGQPLSIETIDAARAAVRKINDRGLQPAAFAALAAARVKAGDTSGSREIFQEALTSATALSRSDQIAAACIRIVNALDERVMFLGRPAGDKAGEAN
jgi:hypothetical protein